MSNHRHSGFILLVPWVFSWRSGWRAIGLDAGPVAAALFFVGTLFPILGFMNVYFMRYSFVCDHWAYLSSPGLIALSASLIVRIAERLRLPKVLCGVAAVLLLALGVLTWQQCKMYTDVETLWRTTLDRNPACWMAHNNLGFALYEKGQIDEAILQFQEAIRLKTDDAEAYNNLGAALAKKGQTDEAISQYQEAIRFKPDYAEAHYNLGVALDIKGQTNEAISQYQEAIRLKPDDAEAHNNLGIALDRKGQTDEAIRQYQEAIRLKPDDAEAHYNLGIVLAKKGQIDEAISQYPGNHPPETGLRRRLQQPRHRSRRERPD